MSRSAQPIWSPEVLGRVRRLHLVARILTNALLQGEHRSQRVGSAIEFADYQPYLPGMDLRHLDWKVMGRSDALVVKRFETETQIPTTIVLDLSKDLATGAHGGRSSWWRRPGAEPGELPDLGQTKAGFAIQLAATLAYFFQLHGEPVGLEIVAGDSSGVTSLPPRSGRHALQRIFLALAAVKPDGQADLRAALTRVGERMRRRSLVMVISDGMEEPSGWLPSMQAFARRKADIRFVHLYEPTEWGLDFDRAVRLYSPEDGVELALDPAAARDVIRDVAREYVAEVRLGIAAYGGLYCLAPCFVGDEGRRQLALEYAARRVILGMSTGADIDPFDAMADGAAP